MEEGICEVNLFYLPIAEGKSLHVFKHLNNSTNFNVSFVKRQENIVVVFFLFLFLARATLFMHG